MAEQYPDADRMKGKGRGTIIVKFSERQGDRMFQYALYKRLLKEGKTVLADLSWYHVNESARRFLLLNFPKLGLNPAQIVPSEDGGFTIHL